MIYDDNAIIDIQDDDEFLANIFFFSKVEQTERIRETNRLFSHYTSAYAAIQIIRNGDIWLRDASVMNDFSEIQYGHDRMTTAFSNEEILSAFVPAIELLNERLLPATLDLIKDMATQNETNAYMTSMSEHAETEENLGRLSMWRAYGGNTNVAMVFEREPLLIDAYPEPTYSIPVLYAHQDKFDTTLMRMITRMSVNQHRISKYPIQKIFDRLARAIRSYSLSTKHPGFAEETEWRIVGLDHKNNTKLRKSIEFIDGVPQTVCHLDLKNIVEVSEGDKPISKILHQIIIGPTKYPKVIKDAFITELKLANISNADDRVVVSNTPLRR